MYNNFMDKENMKSAGLTDTQIHLLCTPFSNLSPDDRGKAFSASDKVAEWNRKQPYRLNGAITIVDRDVLLKDGVLSPIDQKTAFHNRKDWNDHLKRNNCVELGNDRQPKRELQGNFNCRKELAQATRQVLEKQGAR